MEAADAGRTLVLVDAANVMGSRPDGWWRDRVAAVNRLLDELQAWAIGHPGDVVVIVEPVRAASHLEVEVVTADRELRRRVVALGAQVTGPRSLFDRL